jgi:hypothetical protein
MNFRYHYRKVMKRDLNPLGRFLIAPMITSFLWGGVLGFYFMIDSVIGNQTPVSLKVLGALFILIIAVAIFLWIGDLIVRSLVWSADNEWPEKEDNLVLVGVVYLYLLVFGKK